MNTFSPALGSEEREISSAGKAEFRQRERCIACGSQQLRVIWSSSFENPLVKEKILKTFYDGDPLSSLSGLRFRRSRCCECGTTFQLDILTDEWLKVLYGQWVSEAQVDALESSQNKSAFWQAQESVRHCLRLEKMLGDKDTPLRRWRSSGCTAR